MQEDTVSVLPEGFDGVFRFTNDSDQDFSAKWNNVEYTFPARKTSPMIIMGESPDAVQSIRKKFAKEFAEREFYKSAAFLKRNTVAVGETPALYTESELEPYIKSCLNPLPVANATAKVVKNDNDKVFRTDGKGQKISKVVEQGESLIPPGAEVQS